MQITINTPSGKQATYQYEQLAQMWKDGMLKAETLYWKEGMTEWRPLSDLFVGLAPPPPPQRSSIASRGKKISEIKSVSLSKSPRDIKDRGLNEKSGYSGKTFLSLGSIILFFFGSNLLLKIDSKLALIFLVLIPMSLILGHSARKDIKLKNLKGGWLTLITLIFTYLGLIGVVLGVVIASFGSFFGVNENRSAETWVNSTGEAYITSYFALVGDYPQKLSDLKSPPLGLEPFVKSESDLNDPWGKPYRYKYPGQYHQGSFDLWTVTPEGEVIGNWKTSKYQDAD